MAAAGTTGRARTGRRTSTTRKSIERLLPADTVAALRDVAASPVQITPQLLRQLDQRFASLRQHGVSARRLRGFLERTRERTADAEAVQEKAGWGERLLAHRRRQASVASIIDAAFGHLSECDPGLWERRAYLMVLGLVYERLAANEQALSTDELVVLAKALAEHRRIDARLRGGERSEAPDGEVAPMEGGLPDHFADVVRQVYGTNFQRPTEG
jgi:hypothetical protein